MSSEVETPQATVKQKNGKSVAGFILSLVAFFIGTIPGFGFVVWILGLIFSTLGLQKPKRGLAVAGFSISMVVAVCMLVINCYGLWDILDELEKLGW